tara:strand:+ start:316 stop:672 length:357 start_codon:yes stop_codon:yes gene_type:complete
MSVAKAFLSGTQSLGKINLIFSIFMLSLIIVILLFALHFIVLTPDEKWPPKCDNSPATTTEVATNCSDLTKQQTIVAVVIIIVILLGIAYFTFAFRNNKALQTISGANVEAKFIKGLF